MALKDIVLKLIIDGKESLVTLDKLDSKTFNLQKTLKNTAGALGLAFGSYQVIGFMKDSIELVQRENEVIGKLNATLKSTGYTAGMTSNELVELANNLEEINKFKFDDKDIIEAEGLLLTFKKINKEIFPETMQLALDMSVRFEQDLTSSIKMIGKALEDPVRGLTALRKAGVQFDEVQEEQIKKFIKTNDLISAQKKILAELTTQVAGSAAGAVDEYTEKVNRLGEAWENVMLTTGKALTYFATDVYDFWDVMFRSIEDKFTKLRKFLGLPSDSEWSSLFGGKDDRFAPTGAYKFDASGNRIFSKPPTVTPPPKDPTDPKALEKAKKEADEFYKHLKKLEEEYVAWLKSEDELRYWTAKTNNNAGVAARNQRQNYFSNNMNGAVDIPGTTGAEYIAEDLDQIAANAEYFGNQMAGIFDNTWDTIISGSFSAADIMNNLFKSLLDSIGDYIASALSKEATGSFIDTLFQYIPLLAEGGIVTKPTLSVIGESGPEAVVPLDRFNMSNREVRVIVEGELKGDTIYLANKRATINRNKNQS